MRSYYVLCSALSKTINRKVMVIRVNHPNNKNKRVLMKFIAKINFVLDKSINKSSLIRSFFTDLFDVKQLERKPAYNIPIYIRLFIFSFLILASINTAQATIFTETVPNGHGAIPATYPAVGGTMIVLIGANGNIYYQFVNPSTQFEGFSDTGTPAAFRGNPLQLGPTQTLNCGTTACSTYFGGSIVEGYARLTVRDGDSCGTEFDANDVYFELNGLRVSSFTGIPVIAPSSISTERTNMAGNTQIGTENCFRNQASTETSTAWFDLDLVPGLLNNILTAGSTTPRVFDDDPTDNRWFFTDGVDASGTPEVAPGIAIVKTADKTSYSTVGEPITYTFEVTNIGSVDFTNVTVTDTFITGSISCPSTNLAVSASMTCTGSHNVTQANIDNDIVFVNTAEVTGTPTEGILGAVSGTLSIPGPPANNSMILTKVADKTVNVEAGDVITYTYVAENTGNITLENVNITDVHNGAGTLSVITPSNVTLAPGDSQTFTATYTVIQADIDAGVDITNTATGNSTPKRGTITAPTVNESVAVLQPPSWTVTKTTSSTPTFAGDTIDYTFTLDNTGNVIINSISVTDAKCATIPTLTSGDTNGDSKLDTDESHVYSCTSIAVTQAEIDAGVVTNSVSVTGTPESGTLAPATDTLNTSVTPVPSLSITKTAATMDAVDFELDAIATYTYVVKNTGNITIISPVTVSDNLIPNTNPADTITCDTWPGGLAPGDTYNCTGTYTVTLNDVALGSVTNLASGNDGSTTSPETSETIPLNANPALTLVKSSDDTTYASIDDILTYDYEVSNTGNAVFVSDILVTDDKIDSGNPFICWNSAADPDLQFKPDETINCTRTYTVTQADLDTGSVTNNAGASTIYATTTNVYAAPVDLTITATQLPSMNVIKATSSMPAMAGDTLDYTFTVDNTGNVTISSLNVADVKCVVAPTLTSGDTDSDGKLDVDETHVYGCTSIAVTQTEVDAGTVDNSVSVSGIPAGGTLAPATDTLQTVIPDIVAPSVSIAALPLATAANQAAYPVSGSCTDGDNDVSIVIAGATPNPQTAACSGGSYSTTVNVSGIADGTGVIVADATQSDAAGNTANAVQVTADKDATASVVSIAALPLATAANQAAYPVSGSCTDGDNDVSIVIAGATPNPQTAACSGGSYSTTVNVSGIADGTGVIVADATQSDAAGNTANAVQVTADKDATASVVSIAALPLATAANQAAYPVSGSCTDGDNDVSIVIAGATPNPQTAACSGGSYSTTVNVSGIADGTGVIVADATQSDAAGNTANAVQVTADKDATASVVSIAALPLATAANQAAYPVSGSCTDGDNDVSIVIAGATPNPQTAACSGGSYSTTVNVSGIADGTGVIVADATQSDAAGNTANAVQVTADKDATASVVSIAALPLATAANQAAYPVSGSCTDGDNDVSIVIAGATPNPQTAACSGGSYSTTVNVSGIADGTGVIVADATQSDAAGNTANAVQVTADKDATASVVSIAALPLATAANQAAYPVSGSCTDGDNDVSIVIAGATPNPQTAACSGGSYSTTVNVSGIADGTGVIVADATQSDAAGNTANAVQVTADKDATASVVSIAALPLATAANQAAYPVSGSCTDGDNDVSIVIAGATPNPQTAACSGGSYSTTVNVSGIADGTGVIVADATQSDAAGNTANAVQVTADKDATASVVSIAALPLATAANQAAYPVSGSCTDGDNDVSIVIAGATPNPQTAACSGGSYSTTVNVSGIADGTGVIVADATQSDAAGNTANAVQVTADKDATASVVSIAALPLATAANQAAYPVSGSCTDGDNDVSIVIAGATPNPQTAACSGGSYSTTVNVSGIADGTGVIVADATQSDAAGNTANAVQVTADKDATASVVSIAALPLATAANQAAYPVSGSCTDGDNDVSIVIAGATPNPQTAACSGGSYSTTVNVSGIADGTGVIVADATQSDAAGNTANAVQVTADKDATASVVSIAALPLATAANQAAYPVSGSCTDGDNDVSIVIAGATPNPQTAACSGGSYSTTVNVSGIADGTGVIVADATQSDAAGNTANAVQVTADKDATASVVSIAALPLATAANQAAYPVSGSCTDGDNDVSIVIAGATPNPQTAACSGGSYSTTVNVSGIADGTGVIVADATQSDAAGNTANAVQVTADKDATASVVSIAALPLATAANQAAYPVSGSCTDGDNDVSIVIAGATPNPQTAACSGGSYSTTVNVSGIADGTGVIVADATQSDAAGNTANAVQVTADKDATASVVSIAALPLATAANQAAYPVSGSCTDGDNDVSIVIAGATPNPQTAACSGGSYSTTVNVSGIADGTGVIVADATQSDAAGNTANAVQVTADKDATASVVSIAALPLATAANQAAYPVSGSCTDGDNDVSIVIAGATPNPQTAACSGGSYSTTVNVSGIADGTGVIVADATQSDAAGNTANAVQVTADKDATASVVSIAALPLATAANQAAYPVSGSCTDGDNDVSIVIAGATPNPQTAACSGGSYSTTVNVSGIADGTGVIVADATQSDAAGNTANAVQVTADKDATASVVSIAALPLATAANQAAYPVSGSCTDGDNDVSIVIAGATPNPQTAACSGGSYSTTVNVSGIADGTGVIVADATQSDAAGNTANAVQVTADKDATASVVSIAALPLATAANQAAYPVSGSCTDGDNDVSIVIAGATPNPQTAACSGGSYSTTVNVSGIADGTGVIVADATQSDAAGNTANAVQVTADKDATASVVSIAALPLATAANQAAYPVSGSCTDGDNDVSIVIAGATPNPQTAACSGGSYSTTVNVSGIADGTGVIVADATQSDAAGNTANAVQVTADKDATASVVSIAALPLATAANQAAYPVSGSCTDGDNDVSIVIAGATPNPQTAACSGGSYSTTVNVSGIADGTGVIVADATQSDAAGNTANAVQVTADKDATASVVSIAALPLATAANQAAYPVSGSCTDGDNDVSIVIAGATPNPQTAACSGGSYSTTVNVSGIADGTGVIVADATQSDAAGNTANAVQVTADKDATASVVSIAALPLATAANQAAYPVSGSCTDGDNDVSIVIAGATPNPQTAACSGGSYSTTVNVSGIADGTGVIVADATQSDAAGNTANAVQVTADKDATASVVSIAALPLATAANQAAYPVSGSCTDGDNDVSIVIAGATPNPQTAACSGGSYSTTVNVSGIADGTGVIVADATQSDAAGNTANAVQVTADKDASVPAAPTVTITEDANNDGLISFAELNGTVEVSVALPAGLVAGDSVTVVDGNGNTQTVILTAANAAGPLVVSFPAPADGASLTVSATITDVAGNTSPASATDTATVDTSVAAPTVTITEDANNDGLISFAELNGTVEVSVALPAGLVAGDSVTVVDGNGNTQTVILTAANAAGPLVVSFPAPADGASLTVSATITDVAGNTSLASATDTATVALLVDATPILAVAETYPTVNGLNGGVTTSVLTSDTLNGVAVVPSTVTITVDATDPALTLDPATGLITVAAGTAAGPQTVTYTICENLNIANCSQVTETVLVDAAEIEAIADTPDPINGYSGATSPDSVLDNDALNGNPVESTDVTMTVNDPAAEDGVTLNPDGKVTVAPGTAAGSYPIEYSICEKLNPDNCATATVTVTVEASEIEAIADTPDPINGYSGATSPDSVLDNDTLNGNPVESTDVTMTVNDPAAEDGVTLNPDGKVTVAPGTAAGSYPIEYSICEKLNPDNCATATVTVTVEASEIEAIADTPDPINGYSGATSPDSVLDNDALNGNPVESTDVTMTVNDPAAEDGVTLNPDGKVTVAPGTAAGSYPIEYSICEKLNPDNCATATVTVTVEASEIEAIADTPDPINGYSGATSPDSVLDNDTLNGNPVESTDVTMTVNDPGAEDGVTLNPDGKVTVAPGTAAGSYPIEYSICEKLNPDNCATVTVTVTVESAVIEAVADDFEPIDGLTGATSTENVLTNDTLNNTIVIPDEVTLTVNDHDTTDGVTLNPDGTVTVAPESSAGGYLIEYTICENLNPNNCSTQTVSITVEVNHPPVANNDELRDQALGQPVTVAAVLNDADPDGNLDITTVQLIDSNGKSVTILRVSGEGVWNVDPETGDITFTPEKGFVGDPTPVQYTVKDTNGLESNQATVTIDYEEPAAIEGTVWLDRDKDNGIDPDEDRKPDGL